MSGPLTWLREAAAAIVRNEHPGRLLVGDEAAEFITRGNLRYTRMSGRDGSVTGFREDGVTAIKKLAQHALKQHPRLKHGSRRVDLESVIAELVVKRYPPSSKTTPDGAGWSDIDAELLEWLDASARQRRHYVPCALVAGHAAAFDVGPVTFVHVEDIAAHPRGLADDAMSEFTREPLLQALGERHATWIAIVEVEGCQPARSTELADLATDVAIGAVQMAMPGDTGKRMARVTGRTLPPWRGSLAVDDLHVTNGMENMEAGHGLDPHTFAIGIAKSAPMLASAGTSIAALVNVTRPFKTLRGAWCDAVFWYHEATSETLTTVSAVKFETAIETMLQTKRRTGSGERMKQAIRLLTGLNPKDVMPGSPDRNVESYAKSLAEARSQVLHGSISTLSDEVGEERRALAWLARMLLTAVAVEFEHFAAENGASDDIESVIAWFGRRHANTGANGIDESISRPATDGGKQ